MDKGMSDDSLPEIFNLIHAPWIPARRRSGTIENIPPWRITEQMTDDPFVAFAWPRHDFNGATHEFLIGLLSTAATPANEDDWVDWWSDPPAPDKLKERFDEVAHAFNLDGPGPRFLQDLDPLDDAKETGVATLLIETPGAQTLRNNADLFIKRGGAPVLCRAVAAMALYTLSAYAPAGGAGHRTSLRGGGPMTTLIVAEHPDYSYNLWGRLWPNVETEQQIEMRSTDTASGDGFSSIFPWLLPTRTSNPKVGGRSTTQADVHPLQVYWGMPRRIRLQFEDAHGQPCNLTESLDSVIVKSYRTRNYGTNYSEGFEHPFSPYYLQKPGTVKLPVHPGPGGVNYRLWPGIVVQSDNQLRDPAQVVRHWSERAKLVQQDTRFTVFGYDMDNMKARAWIECEMPLLIMNDAAAIEWLKHFISLSTAGAGTVAQLLTQYIKSALFNRPTDVSGDFGFIAERFYRETEADFHVAINEAARLIEQNTDDDDPTIQVRENWAPIMANASLRLFNEFVSAEGIENRDMKRYVKARYFLVLALGGYGKSGKLLFERDLGIALPITKTEQAHMSKEVA